MKDGKAAGCDKESAELIKNSGTITTKELAQILPTNLQRGYMA